MNASPKANKLTSLQRAANHSAQAKALPAIPAPRTTSPVIQRVLVFPSGNRMTQGDLITLMNRHPDRIDDLLGAFQSGETYIARSSRQGLILERYAPPSSGGYSYKVPEGYTTTTGSTDTNRTVAKNQGMDLNLSRTDFRSKFTEELLSSPFGMSYSGAESIQGGKSLSQAGKDRTHHLADSSIRIIVQWLHENRGWQAFGTNWVRNWISALTGGGGVEEIIGLMGTAFVPPSSNDLETVVDRLSNNTNQVGFGDSHTNQKIVGSFFDSPRTKGGFESPISLNIQTWTEGLANIGLPETIIKTALAQVVEEKTGKQMTSMTFFMPPPDEHPFDKRGGGGGFGGGGGRSGGGGGFGSSIFNLVK